MAGINSGETSGGLHSQSANATNGKNEDFMDFELKENAYRSIIAISSIFSIGALLCLCILLPSLYGHVNSMAGFARQDFAFCEVNESINIVDIVH